MASLGSIEPNHVDQRDLELNPEDQTVDEIFKKNTIPEVQRLNRQYKQKIETSKHDLHTLVGSKYRDLIKIAEDIDDMYNVSYGSDGRISDLSYKPSKFLKLSNTNSYSKFDTLIRSKKASEARNKNKIRILRSLIYNRLEKLDLKIATNKSLSPLIHSSNLIYYAKLYYSIETLFSDILKENIYIQSKFQALKSNFIKFVEFELSHYNVLEQSVYGGVNDKVTPQSRLVFTDLINTQPILLDDDLRIYEEFIQDDNYDDGEEEDKFEDEEVVFSKLESFNKNSIPIVNFLLAYTIINRTNPDLDTLSKILEKFYELRYNYLESLLKPLVKYGPTKVNFLKIFRYIENSCIYTDKYLKDINSIFFINLKSYTKSWDATQLIGFKDWIENGEIYFNQSVYLIEIPKSVSLTLAESNQQWITLLTQFLIDSTNNSRFNEYEKLDNSLIMFHNFITDLSKLFDYASYNYSNSKLIDLIILSNKDNIAVKCLDIILNKSESVYSTLFAELFSESQNSISNTIETNLSNHTFNSTKRNLQLFSKDLTQLIDKRLEKYIEIMTDMSLSTSNDEVCESIQNWFGNFVKLNNLIDYKKEIDSNKLTALNSLSSIYKLISRPSSTNKKEIKWGNFSSNLFDIELEKLHEKILADFWNNINHFIERVNLLIKESQHNNIISNYYVLGILLVVKDNITNINHLKEKSQPTLDNIDSITKSLFESIISNIPDENFTNKFDTNITVILKNSGPTTELPLRPSMGLSALMYHISKNFLSAGLDSDELHFGKLFSNPLINGIFIDIKNQWIEDKLITKLYSCLNEVKSVVEVPNGKNGNENKEEEQQEEEEKKEVVDQTDEEHEDQPQSTPHHHKEALSLFADIAFLLQFTQTEPIKEISHSQLKSALDHINEYYGENSIDDTTANIITNGVAEYYRSSKAMYLPLSITN
ncbi:uncharacterized protein RJT21DRAFT_127047 [Scheffersomyces amazonensis]|uniref:uncharacterized protein n=1 Tax=Scheffersomyces amazonensis TaxID=1078765 RepID=UPI00315D2D0A